MQTDDQHKMYLNETRDLQKLRIRVTEGLSQITWKLHS